MNQVVPGAIGAGMSTGNRRHPRWANASVWLDTRLGAKTFRLIRLPAPRSNSGPYRTFLNTVSRWPNRNRFFYASGDTCGSGGLHASK